MNGNGLITTLTARYSRKEGEENNSDNGEERGKEKKNKLDEGFLP